MIADMRAAVFGLIAPPLFDNLLQVALLCEPVDIQTPWGTLRATSVGLLGLRDGSFIIGFLYNQSHCQSIRAAWAEVRSKTQLSQLGLLCVALQGEQMSRTTSKGLRDTPALKTTAPSYEPANIVNGQPLTLHAPAHLFILVFLIPTTVQICM